jgi:hypothetical protein
VADYGTNRLGIVHRHFGTGNTPAVSSGLTCMSKQTGMERDVLIRIPIREAEWGKERTDLLRGTLDDVLKKVDSQRQSLR